MAKSKMTILRELPWSAYSYTKSGLRYAIVEAEGIAFAFTDDHNITFMSDDQGFYPTSDLKAVLQKSGNYSDYAESSVVAMILDAGTNIIPWEDIEAAIKDTPNRYASMPAVSAQLQAANWDVVASTLKPFIEAYQDTIKIDTFKVG